MNKITQALVGGVVGTAAMTGWMMISPKLGFPEMHPEVMLGEMMGGSMMMGWAMHFVIGIIFALGYAMLIINWLGKIENKILKGVVFGLIVWLVAFASMMGMQMMGGGEPPPPPAEGMAMMMIGMILNHVIFGVVTVLFIKGDE